jgi:hypothetical protein
MAPILGHGFESPRGIELEGQRLGGLEEEAIPLPQSRR